MNAVLPFAEDRLAQYGAFYPYGGAIEMDGTIAFIGTDEGKQHPRSKRVIEFLQAGLRAGAREGRYKATALVYDVRTTLPSTGTTTDAVAVVLEHRDDYSVMVVLPYQIAGDEVVFGAPFANPGAADVFPPR